MLSSHSRVIQRKTGDCCSINLRYFLIWGGVWQCMVEEPQGSRRSYINSRRVSFCKGTPDGSGAILLMVSIFSKKSPPGDGELPSLFVQRGSDRHPAGPSG
jgi:hypothetical protein